MQKCQLLICDNLISPTKEMDSIMRKSMSKLVRWPSFRAIGLNTLNSRHLKIRDKYVLGDFQVAFRLCFKASPSAKPFIYGN